MENGSLIWGQINRLYLLIFLAVLVSCNTPINRKEKNEIKFKSLENGVLVCRLGNGYFSDLFREYASKEQKYSHVGIISNENDSVFVYHSEASEFTGVGYVKREPLNSFLDNIETYDFFEFNLPDSTKSGILRAVKGYFNRKTPFDLSFDSFDDKELYCTELIVTSVNKTVNDSLKIIPGLNLNGKMLYALDDIYLNKNVTKIEQEGFRP